MFALSDLSLENKFLNYSWKENAKCKYYIFFYTKSGKRSFSQKLHSFNVIWIDFLRQYLTENNLSCFIPEMKPKFCWKKFLKTIMINLYRLFGKCYWKVFILKENRKTIKIRYIRIGIAITIVLSDRYLLCPLEFVFELRIIHSISIRMSSEAC